MNQKLYDRETAELLLSPEKWHFMTPRNSYPELERIPAEPEKKSIHSHQIREIMIAVSGKYSYGFNGKFYDCRPGTVFMIDSNIKHEYCVLPDGHDFIHGWIYISSDKILVKLLKGSPAGLEIFARQAIKPTPELNLNQFWSEYNRAATPFEQFYSLQKIRLTLGVFYARVFDTSLPTNHDNYLKVMVEMVKERIQDNFHEGISIDQLARTAGYSRFHFVRIFKQYAGCTVQEYLNRCRIHEMERLQGLNYTQKEIASGLGFAHQSAYSAWRRKIMK